MKEARFAVYFYMFSESAVKSTNDFEGNSQALQIQVKFNKQLELVTNKARIIHCTVVVLCFSLLCV